MWCDQDLIVLVRSFYQRYTIVDNLTRSVGTESSRVWWTKITLLCYSFSLSLSHDHKHFILVHINHNYINLECSGPNLNIYFIKTDSRTFWFKIKQLCKYLTKVYIHCFIFLPLHLSRTFWSYIHNIILLI